MKYKLIIIITAIIIISGITFVIYKNNNKPFYLNEKYYNQNDFIEVSTKDVNKLIENKSSFVIYVYNNFCNFKIPCESIFKEFIDTNKVGILKMKFEDFKNTDLYNKVKLAPTVIIVKDGKIIDYLESDSNEDTNRYQDIKSFEKWIKKYIILKK